MQRFVYVLPPGRDSFEPPRSCGRINRVGIGQLQLRGKVLLKSITDQLLTRDWKFIAMAMLAFAPNAGAKSAVAKLAFISPPANTKAFTGLTIAGTCLDGDSVGLSGSGLAGPASTVCTSGHFSQEILFTAGPGKKVIKISQKNSRPASVSRTFVRVIPNYTVTPSGSEVAISPNKPQIVMSGATTTFKMTANPGFLFSNMIGGTCSAGILSGNIYITGPITANCSVVFSAYPIKRPPFIGFSYSGMPNAAYFQSLGMDKVYLVDRALAGVGPPDEGAVRATVAKASLETAMPIIIFDIEYAQYPFDIRHAAKADVDASIAYSKQLVSWARSANPYVRVGFYGVPFADYWTINLYSAALLHPNDPWWKAHASEYKANFIAYQQANAYVASLMHDVDFVFPSTYTFYDTFNATGPSSDGWQPFAAGLITEARKYGKPVYPFLWPQFHPGGSHKDYSYIPADYWQSELKFAHDNADGMVIWGWGGYLHETWNPNAVWWQAVLQIR